MGQVWRDGEETGSLVDLLNRVLHISIDIYNGQAGDGAITHRQFAVLNALAGHEGVSQIELARRSGADRSTLAEVLARMTQKGLVRREAEAGDARIKRVWLTDAGRKVLADMAPRVRNIDSRILELLAGPERVHFVKLLRTLVASYEDGPHIGDDAVPVAESGPKKRRKKHVYKLENLPMPALSDGAVAEPDNRSPPRFKPPKPIWKVGR